MRHGMKLMLITGAGASRRLGRNDQLMPLMPDWSDALCEALEAQEKGLAQACHLAPGMGAEVFEENLGLLLRWDQMRELQRRFGALGGDPVGHLHGAVPATWDKTDSRMTVIMQTINTVALRPVRAGKGR